MRTLSPFEAALPARRSSRGAVGLTGVLLFCGALGLAQIAGPPRGPASFEALAARAAAARDAGRLDQAVMLYRQALAQRPSWEEGWWYLGTLLYDRDDYAAAAAAFEKELSLKPKTGDPYVMLGLCEAKLGRRATALRHLGQGRKIGLVHAENLEQVMLFTQGMLLLEAGEFGPAQEALDALARGGAEQDELVVPLGLAVLGMKPSSLTGADAHTREIVRRAGEAERHAARREVQAAFEAYTELAGEAPQFHNVQFALGRFLLANHEDDKAVAAFEREIANSPNHLLARLGIAGVLAATNPHAALPYAEQAVKLAPALGEAHFLLGSILVNLDQPARAVAELEFAQRQQPGQARIYFPLSKAYGAIGRREDAERALKTFARLHASAAGDTVSKP